MFENLIKLITQLTFLICVKKYFGLILWDGGSNFNNAHLSFKLKLNKKPGLLLHDY